MKIIGQNRRILSQIILFIRYIESNIILPPFWETVKFSSSKHHKYKYFLKIQRPLIPNAAWSRYGVYSDRWPHALRTRLPRRPQSREIERTTDRHPSLVCFVCGRQLYWLSVISSQIVELSNWFLFITDVLAKCESGHVNIRWYVVLYSYAGSIQVDMYVKPI